ncbi:MAG: shikimate dehydrogenase [Candidatus Hydrothermarchaeales archaeon]
MTTRFAVIGHPISHSMSPAMHNAVFEKLGLHCSYTLFDVSPTDLEASIKKMKEQGFGGVNVTIPHKVAVIKHLDDLSDEAGIIGAVNTVKFDDTLKGFNTDGIGALQALRAGGADPAGKKIVVLGSGGAARAISVTIALRGDIAAMSILGIDKAELERLTGDIKIGAGFSAEALPLESRTIKDQISDADILIHATPVGMHPKVGETLVSAGQMKPDLAVMDIVYNPLETRLMKEAKSAGVETIISGVDMFVNQGAEALRIWLDIEPPVELMKKVVVKGLLGK